MLSVHAVVVIPAAPVVPVTVPDDTQLEQSLLLLVPFAWVPLRKAGGVVDGDRGEYPL